MLFVLPLLVSAATAAECAHDCANETEPFLQAPALVQPALLSGPGYRVVPEIEVHGYMAHFLIDTEYGTLGADSVELLAVRVSEVPALESLDRASRSGAFAQAFGARLRKTGAALADVASHPIDTVTGIPGGVARYLSTQWNLWSNRAQSAADRSAREFENKGDPFHAPPGPLTAGRAPLPDAPPDLGPVAEKRSRAWYERAGSETEREAKRYLKYGKERRDMAKLLGVDPNSTNPLLREKLDALAWAAVGGNFSAGKALGAVSGGSADAITWSGKLNQYVLQKTPEELREINRAHLATLCSDDYAVRQFLRRGGFTDTLRTALVQTLQALAPAAGCNELIELAATTRGEVEARYLVDALKLIQRESDATGGTLLVAGGGIAWVTPAGRLLLPLPVDYLSWNAALAEFFDQPSLRVRDKTVLIGGDASLAAQRELTSRAWNLRLRTPFDGAPAYAQGEMATHRE